MHFLIDENLPYRLELFNSEDFSHVTDVGLRTDQDIFEYATSNDLVIVSKDADFHHKVLLHGPPPRVVHVNVGNHRTAELRALLLKEWSVILGLLSRHKLVILKLDQVIGY